MNTNVDGSKKIQDFLKPRANYGYDKNGKKKKSSYGNTNQGYFIPKNPSKYVGDVNNIVFRSGWEFKFLTLCDINDSIVKYSSESVHIPYISPIDNKVHQYFIDMFIEIRCSDGKLAKWLLEIKPDKYIKMPLPPKKRTKKSLAAYEYHKKTTLINIEKFKSAKYWAKELGANFGIIQMNRYNQQFSLIEFDENEPIKCTSDI